MNNMHSNGEQDRSLHETLDKLGRSYAQLDQDEPPELLDMAILNSAHRAVEKQPQRLKFGWLHGLTTAAVFVLALSLIVHQRENQPAVDDTIPFDKLERSRQAEPAKKQSAQDRSLQSLQVSKESAIERMEQPAPSAAAPVVAPREQTAGEALQEYRPAVPDDPGQQSDAVMAEKDQLIQTETINVQELDTAASTPRELPAKIRPLNEMQESAVAGAPQTPEPEVRSNADTQAEAQLRAIIRMRQAGDERWKAELEAFIKSHPDYPLPDELKN
jgi:hypothetical protein